MSLGPLISILKVIGGPGSPAFFVLSVAAASALIYFRPRSRTLGRTCLWLLLAGYGVLSLPWTAHVLAESFPAGVVGSRQFDVLILLGGDNWHGRVWQAQKMFAATRPGQIWVLGEEELLDPLHAAGVPGAMITHVPGDPTTRTQMLRAARLLAVHHTRSAGIIVSRLQASRVAALAQALGLRVTVIPSPADVEPPTSGPFLFVPSYAALCVSRDALYEHAALAYYRWRQWTA